MTNDKITVFLVGPSQTGKTAIANYLADLNESLSSEYHPTQGVRLECLENFYV
jgi:Rab-like protein 5